jgi:hypothetical protein
MKLRTLAALAAGIALTGVAFVLAICAFDTNHAAARAVNAALQFKAHWRGDRENVEDEAKQVLIGPFSFINPDYGSAMARIKATPGYANHAG